jgi:hypothetical protein
MSRSRCLALALDIPAEGCAVIRVFTCFRSQQIGWKHLIHAYRARPTARTLCREQSRCEEDPFLDVGSVPRQVSSNTLNTSIQQVIWVVKGSVFESLSAEARIMMRFMGRR